MRADPDGGPDRFARGVIAGWLSVTALAVIVRVAEWIRTTAVTRSLSAWLDSPIGVTWGELVNGVGVVALIATIVIILAIAPPSLRGGGR